MSSNVRKISLQQNDVNFWAQNGSYLQAWLVTVLITREHCQEEKKELERSRGNMGYKRKRHTIVEIQKFNRRQMNLKRTEYRRRIVLILYDKNNVHTE